MRKGTINEKEFKKFEKKEFLKDKDFAKFGVTKVWETDFGEGKKKEYFRGNILESFTRKKKLQKNKEKKFEKIFLNGVWKKIWSEKVRGKKDRKIYFERGKFLNKI